jgi:hypothetical protein
MADVADRLEYPGELVRDLQRLGDECLSLLDRDPDTAKTIAVEQLDLIKAAEKQVRHPLHKGQPLYNIATVESSRSHQAARGWFIGAFMEDARLNTSGLPTAPATTALVSVYQYGDADLDRFAALARQDPAADPVELGLAIAEHDATNPLGLPFDSDVDDTDLDGIPRDDLVFVGGSYRYESPNVISIARSVRNAGLRPVVVKSFRDRPSESVRQKSFRLLDKCGSAVFDGSGVISPGWVNEVEHIARTPIPTMIVFAADQEDRDPNFSTMLPAKDEIPGLVTKAFTDHPRLPAIVAAWLTTHVTRPLAPASGWSARRIGPGFITAAGRGNVNGSNTTYSSGPPTPGSALADAPVGSGGFYPGLMPEHLDPLRESEQLARHRASGKPGPPPLLIPSWDGTISEVGDPPAPEFEDGEEGPIQRSQPDVG